MPKEYQMPFVLPDGEEPAAVVTVIVGQSGRMYISGPKEMPFIDAAGILTGGVQVALSNAKKQIVQAAAEDPKIARPDFSFKKPLIPRDN